jgi:hypothetical protein
MGIARRSKVSPQNAHGAAVFGFSRHGIFFLEQHLTANATEFPVNFRFIADNLPTAAGVDWTMPTGKPG